MSDCATENFKRRDVLSCNGSGALARLAFGQNQIQLLNDMDELQFDC